MAFLMHFAAAAISNCKLPGAHLGDVSDKIRIINSATENKTVITAKERV